MSELEARVREIFTEAVALPPSEWAGLLARRCENSELRVRVQFLLDHHVKSDDFLSRPATETFPGLAETVGRRIAEFRIVKEIGRGGMGVVYLAEDTVLQRLVALKILQPDLEPDGLATDRFRREALAVARLTHPGIVQIYRYGQERGFSYIAMEYVEGETLRSRLLGVSSAQPAQITASRLTRWLGHRSATSKSSKHSGREYITQNAALISEVADALDHAHRQGVIHRDVKPSNILIDGKGHVRLTDFGVASIVTEKTLSHARDIAGSYPYMSPEQARVQSVEIDHRSDIFSLGVILYEVLALRRPFDGTTPEEILRSLSESQPRPLRLLNDAVPTDLATICHKAIEKLPHNRYQTAAHMAADLRCFLRGRPILAKPPSLQRRARTWAHDHRRILTVAALVTLCGLCGLLLLQRQRALRAYLAHLSIQMGDTSTRGTVHVLRWDPQAHTFRQAQRIGETPITDEAIEPGLYRVLVIDGDGRFVELDDYFAPGTSTEATAWVRPEGEATHGMIQFSAKTMPARYYDPLDGSEQSTPLVLPAFWLDATEVTNRQYLKFVVDTQHARPRFWTEADSFDSIADRPVVDVARADMEAYAHWAGKRLPTAYEWLAAAQAPDGRVVPWGGSPPPRDLAPTREMLLADQDHDAGRQIRHYLDFVHPVGQSPESRTPSGLDDMFGNVMEMTGTVVLRDGGANATVAGGYWSHDPNYFDLRRVVLYPSSAKSPQIGFRCARSVSSPVLPPIK